MRKPAKTQTELPTETQKISHNMEYFATYSGSRKEVQDDAAIRVLIRFFPALFGKFSDLFNKGYWIENIERNSILLATVKTVIMENDQLRREVKRLKQQIRDQKELF